MFFSWGKIVVWFIDESLWIEGYIVVWKLVILFLVEEEILVEEVKGKIEIYLFSKREIRFLFIGECWDSCRFLSYS